MTTTLTDRLCAVAAGAAQEDPIGTGSTYTRVMALEAPTPWGASFLKANPEGTIPQRASAIRLAYYDDLRAKGVFEQTISGGYPALFAIAPDPEWSNPAERRVLMALPPAGGLGQFEMREYFFPFESLDILDLVDAFLNHPDQIDSFERFRRENPTYREFLVCTHGQVDICCAKFGIPLYRQAREAYPKVRAWRTSHFGGHRFAPTAMELPSAYKWAFLDEDATERLLNLTENVASLDKNMRGFFGFPSHLQLLDRQGFLDYGWQWLDLPRTGTVQKLSDENRWSVALQVETPTGQRSYEGIVGYGRSFPNPGCGVKYGTHSGTLEELRLESFSRR